MKITSEIQHDIDEMKVWASEPNWDSYGATPITDEDIQWAYDVIEALPELGEDVYCHVYPGSLEFDWGPVNLWFTFASFGNTGTGALMTLDSHDPFHNKYKNYEKEEDDVDITACGQWFVESRQTFENLIEENLTKFRAHEDVDRVEFVMNDGSFRPFQFFVWMNPNFKGKSTGFIWQNFRAQHAFKTDDYFKRSFFQCTQITDMRTVASLSASDTQGEE